MKERAYNLKVKRKEQSDFTETHRHLREHGNAFFIVVMEVLLGISLFHCQSGSDILLVILVWIVRPKSMWFFDNYFELFLFDMEEEKSEREKDL